MRTPEELEKRRVYATYYNAVVRDRQKQQKAINATAGLPWRDCNAHKRGGAFAHEAPVVETPVRVSVDAVTGIVTKHRGSGFYFGKRS